MNIAVLDRETLGDDISLEKIEKLGNTCVFQNSKGEEVKERIKDKDVVVVNKVKLFEDVLKEAKNLKLICLAATGYDNVDIPFCKKMGIGVANVVGYSSHSVAQLTLSMVLGLSVNMKAYTDFVTSGKYTESGAANRLTPVYHEVFGKTWGIVGYGNIGKEVGAAAKALGCKVITNRKTKSNEEGEVSLDELVKTADIITVHTPLTDETRGMIGRREIGMMKKDVILVNAARGAVFDEEAVCDAILDGKIGAFGTDVYSVEPFGKDHPFNKILEKDNVYLTPHMAWGSYEARERCIAEITKNIIAFEKGETRNRVDLV